MGKMNREEAIAYLERKGQDTSEENIASVEKDGKIFGDPFVEVKW